MDTGVTGGRVALTKKAIGDAALAQVQQAGLSSLSMRGVAAALDVRPGALYWHVDSKQELLGLLARRILAGPPFSGGVDPDGGVARTASQLADDLRASLLTVRDGAEIVSFARALRPDEDLPVGPIRFALRREIGEARPERETAWAARALVHFVLGFVAEEQNRAELERAGVEAGRDPAGDEEAAFEYGIHIVLDGAGSRRAEPTARGRGE